MISEYKFSFECSCGVVIHAASEKSLEELLLKHESKSNIHNHTLEWR